MTFKLLCAISIKVVVHSVQYWLENILNLIRSLIISLENCIANNLNESLSSTHENQSCFCTCLFHHLFGIIIWTERRKQTYIQIYYIQTDAQITSKEKNKGNREVPMLVKTDLMNEIKWTKQHQIRYTLFKKKMKNRTWWKESTETKTDEIP